MARVRGIGVAVITKDIEFRKDHVTFKCIKLWANIKDDGQLHFFPASAALKGTSLDYPQTTDIILRTSQENVAAAQIVERLGKLCMGVQESSLGAAPQSIIAFIQKAPLNLDTDSGMDKGFKGTPPKAVSNSTPSVSKEAQMVGQAGKETFVVYVDEQGKGAVVAFTHLLQYGLEEATIDVGMMLLPQVIQ